MDAPRTPAAFVEPKVALQLTLVVLLTLTVVKPIAGIPFLGVAAATAAAVLQLYLPIRRAEKNGGDVTWVGLHLAAWRRDVVHVLLFAAAILPLYAIAYHLLVTRAHGVLDLFGLHELARHVPAKVFAWRWPADTAALMAGAWWLTQTVATHLIGVALPEETFYRGYLQPQLEHLYPPKARIFGVPLGKAAVIACLLFALGHYLGEWNPLRLGPFFPALAFAWLRNATGSVFGSICFHALCNVFGAVLYTLYQ
ncbi:MAG: myxosortase family intramembrane protease [Myxococcota bacterium]|nr:CPBP family intramembrane glutamic endopeptidase [Myxococcota bacterium]